MVGRKTSSIASCDLVETFFETVLLFRLGFGFSSGATSFVMVSSFGKISSSNESILGSSSGIVSSIGLVSFESILSSSSRGC